MAIDVKQFEFTANTSTGTQQIASGLGFTPKAYIIFGSMTSADATYQSHHSFGIGVSDGSTSFCNFGHSEDAIPSSDTGQTFSNDAVIRIMHSTNMSLTNGIAAHSSFGSGTITINWTEAPDTSFKFYGIAFGGSGLSVKLLQTTVGTASTGNQAYTGVGFQGKAGFFFDVNSGGTLPVTSSDFANCIGFAISSSKRFTVSCSSEDGRATMDTWRYADSTKCYMSLSASTGIIVSQADFVSWDSDGFTLNWTNNPTSATDHFFALVFGGDGTWDCGKVAKRTSTGTTQVSPSAETLEGIMLFSNNTQDSTSVQSHGRISMGVASGTGAGDQGGCWSGDKDATADSETAKRSEDSNALIMATEHATDTSSTTEAIANISAMSTTFTLNYTTCTTLAADIFWVAVGETSLTPITKTLTLKYNIIQEITKQLTLKYNIIAETTKQLSLLYDIQQEITKTLTLKYNISNEVLKTLTLLYDIESALSSVTKTLTLKYDILQETTKTLTLKYDIEQEITKTLTLLYDVRQEIQKPLTLKYNIIQETTKTLTLKYNIIQETTKILNLLYDILEEVDVKSLTLKYNIAQEVEKSLTLKYNIIQEITKSLTLKFNIIQETIKALTLKYNVSNEVTKSLTLLYDIKQEITKTLTLLYDIEALASVTKSLTLKYNIEQEITKLLRLRYNIQAETLFVSSPRYMDPLRARIQFSSRVNPSEIYYDYNSFDTDNRPFNILAASIRLAQGEIGSFTIDIEDAAEVVDKSKIGFGNKLTVTVRKENGQDWKPMVTGFVRRLRKIRSATGVLIWRVTAYGTQIVFNERVVNFRRAAKREAIDSSIPLFTDERMLAHRLFEDLITANDILPLRKPTIQNTGGFVSLDQISDEVTDFIAQIAPGLTDAASVANAIAEITGGIWGVDSSGNPFFRYPTSRHSGIIITDNPQDSDSALITSTNIDTFEYEDSIDQSEGFANRLYVLNAIDTKSTASSSQASGSSTLTFRGIAQQFTATDNNITGAAFILSKVGNPVPSDNADVITGYLRADNQNFPTGATLATIEISINQITNAAETIFVNDIKHEPGVIVPGLKYWWYLVGRFTDDSHTVRWHHNNVQNQTGQPPSAVLPLVDADPTQPGSQLIWQRSDVGPVYSFSTFSSVRHIISQSDAESIDRYGLIEGIVDLPAFEDDDTFSKALVKILQTSAKPKRIYDYARVTIPTDRIFLPGELVTVVDSKAKLTSEKNITAEIAEVNYTFDTKSNALGVKYCDIRLIGFLDETVDDYLDNNQCI